MINEVWRILKPGGLFRLSVPDYRFDVYYKRSLKDSKGNVIFDRHGGGTFENYKIKGGHLWFPNYENVLSLIQKSKFVKHGTIKFLHYNHSSGKQVTHKIDYTKAYISRTPDNDSRAKKPYRPMSIVADMYKK